MHRSFTVSAFENEQHGEKWGVYVLHSQYLHQAASKIVENENTGIVNSQYLDLTTSKVVENEDICVAYW